MMKRRELERIDEAHAPSVFALFLQFTRNETDARDLLQDRLVNTAGSRYRYGLEKLRVQLRPCFNEIVPS